MGLLEDHVEIRAYRTLKNMRAAYTSGRVSAERFAKALLRHASRMHLQNQYVDVLKSLSTGDPDSVEVAMAQVYKEVSSGLSSKRPLMSYLRPSLPNEPTVRKNLALVNSDVDLLKRLISNQLSPSEVKLAFSRVAELERTARLLVQDQPVTVDVSSVIRESLEFYPLAIMRDETLVKKSLAHLDKMGSESTGILVAGGFHTDAIASYLQNKNIPYIVIHPNVDRDLSTQEQINYVKRMADVHVTAQELAQDIQSVQTGKKLALGPSTDAAFYGVKQGDAKPGDADKFGEGLTAEMISMVQQGGDALLKVMEKLMLDPNAEAVEGITLKRNGNDWVVEGQGVGGRSTFAELAREVSKFAANGEALPDTIRINTLGDRDMLTKHLSLAQIEQSGSVATLTMPASRFKMIQAVDEGRALTAGSRDEKIYHAAVGEAAHEKAHILKQDERTTTVVGLGVAAANIAARQGAEAAPRFAEAIQADLSASKATQDMGGLVRRVLTPNAFKTKSAGDLVKALSAELPDIPQDRLAVLLQNYEGTTVALAAKAGYSKPLVDRIRRTWGAMQQVGMAA